uniref:Uncharacterized protein n=1 Tax=Acrobeloides nanus TaxID=290746 RepID=A0A914ENQ4_9BILA
MKFLALLILLVALVAVFGQTNQPVNNHAGRYRRDYGHTLFIWYFVFRKHGRSGHKSHSHESRSDESSTISHSSTATITINGIITTATPRLQIRRFKVPVQ